MVGKQNITWWVPRWAFLPKLWQSLRRCVLNQGSLVRIGFGSLIASVATVFTFKLAFPAMVLPQLWTMAIAVPGVLAVLVLQIGTLAAIPPRVSLRNDRIHTSHGQSGLQIKAADFLSTQLYVHRDDKVRLRIQYRRRGRTRALVIGVPPTVDLDRLVAMLPIKPVIRDARSRAISIRNGDSHRGNFPTETTLKKWSQSNALPITHHGVYVRHASRSCDNA